LEKPGAFGVRNPVLRFNGTVNFNPSNAELKHICHLMALLGAHHILYVSRVRVKNTESQNE
jgi:hypothetical protein